jgi:Domain of unknown function (DUF4389)
MYPVTYEADHQAEGRNRLTTFFRYIVAIPWLIVVGIYGFVASIAVIAAWFALVFTAKYPEGIYNFVAGYVRMHARVNAFIHLATDEWPPFDGNEHPDYPVRTGIPAPKAEYSRLKAGLRLIVGIPVILLAYVQTLIAYVIAIIAWFAILFTGKLSEGLFDPMRSALAYVTRATAYFALLTEDYPPFTLEQPGSAPASLDQGTTAAAPQAQAPATPPPPPPDPGTRR